MAVLEKLTTPVRKVTRMAAPLMISTERRPPLLRMAPMVPRIRATGMS